MTRLAPSGKIENKINEYRTGRSLTQQDLADAVGVTRATIVALERGDYNPSLELAFRVSKFFNLKIEDVFRFKKENA